MRRIAPLLVTLLTLTALGCGDSPQILLRDITSYYNELADQSLRVTDDASAKETREGRFKQMKARQEWIKGRLDQVKDSKKKLQAFFDEAVANAAELEACAAYLQRAKGWLQNVGGDAANLANELEPLANLSLPQQPPK